MIHSEYFKEELTEILLSLNIDTKQQEVLFELSMYCFERGENAKEERLEVLKSAVIGNGSHSELFDFEGAYKKHKAELTNKIKRAGQ